MSTGGVAEEYLQNYGTHPAPAPSTTTTPAPVATVAPPPQKATVIIAKPTRAGATAAATAAYVRGLRISLGMARPSTNRDGDVDVL